MKKLAIIAAILISSISFAQDPMIQNDAPKLEEKAFSITREYNNELALDGKQVILFQKKIEEFLIRRQKIEEELRGKEMLDALVNLQAQESLEMQNILTRPQVEVYNKIKARIQPVSRVEKRH